jgi:pimeloyl-ACP methyl ester carboxylesterase
MSILKDVFFASLTALFVIMSMGCSSADPSTGSYNSPAVYDRPLYSTIAKNSMAYEGIYRNPVIVVHGFLGARLKNANTGETVWGYITGREAVSGFTDHQLREFALPMAKDKTLKELKDHVYASELLESFTVKVLGMQFNVNAYNKMLDLLGAAGYIQEGKPLPKNKHFYSLFTFYYDWRRDIPENAARLHDFILQKRAYLQQEYKKLYGIDNYNVQFDVLAHSMGGMVSRYYLRYGNQDLPADGSMPKLDWFGSKYIDKLIIVGTPNAGYLDTFVELTSGLQVEPDAPVYPPAVIGTFPTYYQMLPLYSARSVVYADDPKGKAVNLFNPEEWIKNKWGLANPNNDETLKKILPNVKTPEERHAIALDHLAKCLKRAKQFTDALRVDATPPDDVNLYLFLGDAVPTRRTAAVDRNTGTFEITDYEAGDGKVLASSARMDEREGRQWTPFMQSPIKWQTTVHLSAAHMGITLSQEFADNVVFFLLENPTKNQQNSIKKYQTNPAK